jgi:hypothetical protein
MKDNDGPSGMPREEEIFNAALLLDGPTKRRAFLDLICDEDVALRARLEKLLALANSTFLEFMRAALRLSTADGGGVGICVPGLDLDALQLRR